MANKKYDGPIDRFTDFTDAGPNGEPASGYAVQTYIKGIDAGKVGIGYTMPGGGEHLFFADEHDKELYISDPTTYAGLVIDRIELSAQYTLDVNPITPPYVTAFLGSTGNAIEYTFVTKNRNGQVIPEPVTVTYVITKGMASTTVIEVYQAGTTVSFNIDKYLSEGSLRVDVSVKGQTTSIVAPFSVQYNIISLSLTDTMSIAQVADGTDPNSEVEIGYVVTGAGAKNVYWYLDGVLYSTDTISDSGIERTKFISAYGLAQGVHHIQVRAGITISGNEYLTNVHYREFFVTRSEMTSSKYVSIASDFPDDIAPVGAFGSASVYSTQYEPYTLRVATWAADGTDPNELTVKYDTTVMASLSSQTGNDNEVILTFAGAGEHTLNFVIGETTRSVLLNLESTSMDISELTDDLIMAFSAQGKSNESSDKDSWTDGTHSATLTGFDFTKTSGWVDGRLLIPSGAHIDFDYAPFGVNPTISGYTLEMEFRTYNVDDDDAVLINMLNADTGAGIKLTATEFMLYSRDGVNMSRRFKTGEDLRISVVINRSYGATLACLAQVYFNGVLSITQHFANTDTFLSPKVLKIGGTGAAISLKQLRMYGVAFNSDNVINNYILYRDTVTEMLEVYNRNDIYQTGTNVFDIDKIAATLPVMIITGDMSEVEHATTTSATSYVDIDYINLQDPSKSFKWKHVTIRPQGTSSLGYPRKNLRLYTKKSDETVVYDADGNIVADRLYSFKRAQSGQIPQRVECWTLKADFAESSGTHNTGVARIWNDVMKRATTGSNVYPLRTQAQSLAISHAYPYDVRTTIDGFPIVVFHRLTEEHNLTFVGKYNFNNDKSTESVFGFEDIEGEGWEFDNTHVECWEFRLSDVPLVLFKTSPDFQPTQTKTAYEVMFDYYAENYDNFKNIWECRYQKIDPDHPTYGALRRVASWINTTENDLQEWKDHKADYFDLPKLAAYYVYLMRFGAVDQTVKNAMITTEDGYHWYFINYDNDTILGVRNDGLLKYDPYIDRQSFDSELGMYAYAGHDSVLWNNFEADPECMALVKTIDDALYGAQLTYATMIDMFNVKQAGKWSEKICNQDAMYKYIEPYIYSGEPYLASLQGSRSDHRKWWISTRFSYLDAIYVNDAYQNRAITTLIPGAVSGDTFNIVAGKDFYYGHGYDTHPTETGVHLELDEQKTFTLQDSFGIGQPLRIYSPEYIKTLDLSPLMTLIQTRVDLSYAYSETLGSKMKNLILGITDPEDLPDTSLRNNSLTELPSVSVLQALERLNIAGYTKLTTLDLSHNENLKTLEAKASGLTSVTFAEGAPVTTLELPSSMSALVLKQLPSLQVSGIDIEKTSQNKYNITNFHIEECQKLSHSLSFFLDWLDNKAADDELCTVYIDNILWENVAKTDFDKVLDFMENGGTLTFKGVVKLQTIYSQENAERIIANFGETVFNPASGFYIDAPAAVYLSGPTTVLEGESKQYSVIIIGGDVGGTVRYDIYSGSRSGVSFSSDGLLTTTELQNGSSVQFVLQALYEYGGEYAPPAYLNVTVAARTYPSSYSISGNGEFEANKSYEFTLTYPSGYTGLISYDWDLTGDLVDDGYASITSTNGNKCVVSVGNIPQDADPVIPAILSCTLTKTNIPSVTLATVTLDVAYVNNSIAVSSYSNPVAMQVLYANLNSKGKCASQNVMTKLEAASVTPADLATSDNYSIFSKNSYFANNCTSFNEFRYFVGVRDLPYRLFSSCKLQSVTLPSSVQTIGQLAFYNSGITSIEIPSSVTTIGNQAFAYCYGLTEVTIPGSITSFGSSVFDGCSHLESAILENGITATGSAMFIGCTSLTSVTLPSSLTRITNQTFERCTSLETFSCPSSVASIQQDAFKNCYSLESITLNEGLLSLSYVFSGCNSLVSISIPSTVSSVANGAFRNSAITTLTVNSNNATYYDDDKNCVITKSDKKLVAATNGTTLLPLDLETINPAAFYQLGIESIVIPENVTSVGEGAFNGCAQLESVTLPSGLTSISNSCFGYCSALESIELPSSITTIGSSAFQNCSSLQLIDSKATTAPSVNSNTFYNIAKYGTLTYPSGSDYSPWLTDNATYLGYYSWNAIETTIDGISYRIGNDGYTRVISKIEGSYSGDIVIPSSVTYNGSSYNVTGITYEAFANCTNLTSVQMPNSIVNLGNRVFYGDNNLTSVTLPTAVTTLPDYTFNGCEKLASITIPSGVTSIGMMVFYNCKLLTSITIPSGVTTIGSSAFASSGLTTVTIPDSVISVGDGAFSLCQSLTSATLSSSMTSVSTTMFYGCALTSIEIPASVSSLSYLAFYNCPLATITLLRESSVVSYGSGALPGTSVVQHIYVPASLVSSYRLASSWSAYSSKIEAIPSE